MAPPLLVVEVVSPDELQRDRDYIAKRAQYLDRGIPEYWIINPEAQNILVLTLTNNTYTEFGSFSGDEKVRSPQFTTLDLAAKKLFEASTQAEPQD